jgi:hypothetical protein
MQLSRSLSKPILKLCNNIGIQLQQHSDRNVPCTMFRKGFSTTANLKGHEYYGWLLVILISLYTLQYQEIFSTPVQTKKVRLKKVNLNVVTARRSTG